MTTRFLALPLALCALAPSVPALAAPFADLAAIDHQVANFVAREVGQSGLSGGIMPVDRRLRLSPCQQSLALSWYGKTRDSVIVQCPAPDGWRLFVPVRQDTVGMPALQKAVSRGDPVTIVVRGDNYRLSDRGVAMGNGFAGDWIEVRPGRKDAKPLQARVVSPGVVDIQLP